MFLDVLGFLDSWIRRQFGRQDESRWTLNLSTRAGKNQALSLRTIGGPYSDPDGRLLRLFLCLTDLATTFMGGTRLQLSWELMGITWNNHKTHYRWDTISLQIYIGKTWPGGTYLSDWGTVAAPLWHHMASWEINKTWWLPENGLICSTNGELSIAIFDYQRVMRI